MSDAAYVPAQGDLIRLLLDPGVGRGQSGDRPALVDQMRSIDLAARHVRAAGRVTRGVIDEALGKLGAILGRG